MDDITIHSFNSAITCSTESLYSVYCKRWRDVIAQHMSHSHGYKNQLRMHSVSYRIIHYSAQFHLLTLSFQRPSNNNNKKKKKKKKKKKLELRSISKLFKLFFLQFLPCQTYQKFIFNQSAYAYITAFCFAVYFCFISKNFYLFLLSFFSFK